MLPQQADLSVMPVAPTVNPGFYANAGLANAIPEIAQGLQLGETLARLPQLQDQLALEKAQRKAEMAQTQFKQATLDHMNANFSQYAQVADTANQAAVALSQQQAAGANNAATTANAFAAGQGPQTIASADLQQAQNNLSKAAGSKYFDSLPPTSQAALSAAAASIGGTYGSFGAPVPQALLQNLAGAQASPTAATAPNVAAAAPGQAGLAGSSVGNSFGEPAAQATSQGTAGLGDVTATLEAVRQAQWLDKTTDTKEVPAIDPATGNTVLTQVRVSKRDGSIVYSAPLGVTKLADQQRPAVQAARDVTNLAQAQASAVNLQSAFADFSSKYPASTGVFTALARQKQAQAAAAASNTGDSQISVLEKGLGGMLEDPKTQAVVAAMENYKAALGKLDSETGKTANDQAPSLGDLANPDVFKAKIKGSTEYIDGRIQVYKDRGIGPQIDPKLGVSTAANPPTATQNPSTATANPSVVAPGTVKFIGGAKYVFGVNAQGQPGWLLSR
jgi:hypothetical protein